jgi:hypothetical protein
MTIAGSRSDKGRKDGTAPPEMLDKDDCEWFCIQGNHWIPIDYDPAIDAYRSWALAIDELHDRMVAELVADHNNRMPQS